MIGELAVTLKLLDAAFVACSSAISKKREVEDMASEVGRFFTAKKKVEIELEKARANTNPDDLLEGSSLEEAIKIQEAEDRVQAMMSKLASHYSRKGASHKWAAIKKNAAIIEAKRKKAAKLRLNKANSEDAFLNDVKMVIAIILGGLIAFAGIMFALFGFSAE